ncbi:MULTISPECIES: sigma-70 family RNA polymerase sigma factor [Bacillus]|uniref:Sigma-70 family RNA polymerase sigma factor n=1 Tax=Bacillus glycinifermentans TaxID=1664069 RepID=A0AAJ3Z382_9BACI|nr:sigma-70 family RNA polymerase sigma factor [Bacillus glycinifermentans]NUJ16251.1 sigma-70 family RNA polymerase sigma factor [Bacillus glycinifermentans]QAT67145.1 sigma-70 family RNA polymerase sigma factor [Bacillus glycinifermentans]
MEENKNLIQMVLEYQETKNSRVFNEIFRYYQDIVEKIAQDFSAARTIIKDDIISALNERLWQCIETFNVTTANNLDSVIAFHLKRKAVDVIRGKQGTYVDKRVPIDTTSEENAATFESGEHFDLEEYVISRTCGEIKTDQDKLQLIEALTEKSDSLTTAIVNEHLASERPTYASIGQRVGVHYKKVERVIKGLAKNYDASKYGELNAFLSV